MVVVKIELWPGGMEEKARILGICSISNDLSGNKDFGNYKVELSHAGKYILRKGMWKKGQLKHHRRSLSPYHLVYAAIKACLWPERKG